MREHLRKHHAVEMHPDAEERTVNDLHHYDHTFNRPGHKLNEHLATERPDAATLQRAKSDRWKSR